MSSDQQLEPQTPEDVRDNIVKMVDKNDEFYGSGFFIEVNNQKYCITCHHCIYEMDQVFVKRSNNKYPAMWIEEYSDMKKDVAVLKVENCPLKSLLYSEALAKLEVIIRGFSGEKIKAFPEGTSGKKSSLSDSTTPFQVEATDFTGNNKWNRKPEVYVNVYECEGTFEFGFSGSPVYYERETKVVGMFTAKDNNFGYVIPIQTITEIFRKTISQPHPTLDTRELLESGNSFFDNEDYPKAIGYYDQIIADRNFAGALYNKGLALEGMNKYDQALKWYDKALNMEPNAIDILFNKGRAIYNMNADKESLDWYDKRIESLYWYDKALAINPKYFYALTEKAITLGDLGRYEEALRCFDKALEIEPNNVATLYNKGLFFGKMGNYDEEIKWYDNALKIQPDYINALISKGGSLLDLEKYQDAIVWAKKALGFDKNATIAQGIIETAEKKLAENLQNKKK